MARKKDPNREYDKNGRVKPLEGPTPETALKHQERAQRYRIPVHMEAGYAESTMGILYARGMISVEQYELCKKLANLRSVLYGSGNARCSSVENVGRGLPSDRETKSMRETWDAYKSATQGLQAADRRLFEMAILRNVYREWMKLEDGELCRISQSPDHNPRRLWERIEADCLVSGSMPALPVNYYRTADGSAHVYAFRRELRAILRVILFLSYRMSRNGQETPDGYIPIETDLDVQYMGRITKHKGAISDGMANALYGGDKLLDELYAAKSSREKSR